MPGEPASPVEALPPFDEEAEAGALSCVLAADGEAGELLSQLTREDFCDLGHRLIFINLARLSNGGKPPGSRRWWPDRPGPSGSVSRLPGLARILSVRE